MNLIVILLIIFLSLENQKFAKMPVRDINRIKLVLVEKKRTAKWLAEKLKKDPATVSKWCTNSSQPSLETLVDVANVLEVDVKELLNHSKDNVKFVKIEH